MLVSHDSKADQVNVIEIKRAVVKHTIWYSYCLFLFKYTNLSICLDIHTYNNMRFVFNTSVTYNMIKTHERLSKISNEYWMQ